RHRQALRHGRGDVLEVRRLAADQAAEADERVELAALGGMLRGHRDFERAGDAHDRDVAGRDAGRGERRQGAGLQAVGDEVVVFRHHEREPEPRRAPCPLNRVHARYFPWNSALRFSRNALVPSRMSSVEATRPKSVASYWHASANGISYPLLTALMM